MTKQQLETLINAFTWENKEAVKFTLSRLSDNDLCDIIKVLNLTGIQGGKYASMRTKMYCELFSRNNIGKPAGRYLNNKQKEFLSSLGLLPDYTEPKNKDLDDIDNYIINYLKSGFTQKEISDRFISLGIKPNSLSIIEKRLKAIRDKLGAKTNFHLAVILYSK